MASYNEMIKAAEAIKQLVPLGYGMTWDEAKGYAMVALSAAEIAREQEALAGAGSEPMAPLGDSRRL